MYQERKTRACLLFVLRSENVDVFDKIEEHSHVGWAERSLRSPTITVGLSKQRSAQPT